MAVLKTGSKGGPVKALQEKLNKAGAKPKLKADAIFGPNTKEAVMAFQKKSKLKADGIVGKKTEAALGGGGGKESGSGGAKSGGAGGGKGGGKKGAVVPKAVMQKLDVLKFMFFEHLGDMDDITRGLKKAHKAIKGKPGLSEREKEKHLKPITVHLVKAEKSQRKLATNLSKNRNIMAAIDQKSGGGTAKKLIKLGKSLDSATKGYVAHSKSTQKMGQALLKKYANDDRMSLKEIDRSFSEVYFDSRPASRLIYVWWDLYETAEKAD